MISKNIAISRLERNNFFYYAKGRLVDEDFLNFINIDNLKKSYLCGIKLNKENWTIFKMDGILFSYKGTVSEASFKEFIKSARLTNKGVDKEFMKINISKIYINNYKTLLSLWNISQLLCRNHRNSDI